MPAVPPAGKGVILYTHIEEKLCKTPPRGGLLSQRQATALLLERTRLRI